MRRLVLVVVLGLGGCFEVIDLSPPEPDAGFGDAGFDDDAAWTGDAGLPDAAP